MESIKLLKNIYNNIWSHGNFPNIWKQTIIIPVPKPGKDTSDSENYWFASLTSCQCKTIERMINDRFIWYLETNDLNREVQCGLKKKRSTIDYLVCFEATIKDAFVRNKLLTAVFFDLEKAYDTTWKNGVMRNLHTLGMRDKLLKFINGFLYYRKFKIWFGSTLPDFKKSKKMDCPEAVFCR